LILLCYISLLLAPVTVDTLLCYTLLLPAPVTVDTLICYGLLLPAPVLCKAVLTLLPFPNLLYSYWYFITSLLCWKLFQMKVVAFTYIFILHEKLVSINMYVHNWRELSSPETKLTTRRMNETEIF
jgi:hypothetical protein